MSTGAPEHYVTPTHTWQKSTSPYLPPLAASDIQIKLHFVAGLIMKIKWNLLTADESKTFGLESQS